MQDFSRREFLLALSGAALLSPLAAAAQERDSLRIRFFCPRWGATDPWDAFCKRVKEAGYDGVETSLPKDASTWPEITAALKKHHLGLIVIALPSSSDFLEHRRSYETMLRAYAALNPLFINSQTGKDFFTFAQNKELLAVADNLAKETGVNVIHETHRGRFSFAAHIAKPFLEQTPDLRITFDISHWCNVAESLLENQPEAVALALNRTDHIHARVGHPEGPQINDPRAPEWEQAIKAHLAWWDQVVEIHRRKGSASLTITPEFGPPNYMPTMPYTKAPLSDQWEVNLHMKNLLKARYGG